MDAHAETIDPAATVRFYWTKNGAYHWQRSCADLLVALYNGAQLIEGVAPPSDAVDGFFLVRSLLLGCNDDHQHRLDATVLSIKQVDSPAEGRHFCRLCPEFWPSSEEPDFAPTRCRRCGCSQEMHQPDFLQMSPFSGYCGMAWTDVDRDENGETLSVGLMHCECTGYAAE